MQTIMDTSLFKTQCRVSKSMTCPKTMNNFVSFHSYRHKTYKEKQYYQRNYGHRGKELIELGSGDFELRKTKFHCVSREKFIFKLQNKVYANNFSQISVGAFFW